MKTFFKSLGTVALMSAVFVAASAADFGSKKYYINPGHGGHDSNDRPTQMPLGVEIFYESDGNLSRGIFLRDFLKANNAQVKMSRTTNTTADDKKLSVIAAESNSYAGYFMSLHTNGSNASANYIVSFFRSTSAAPSTEKVKGSKSMALAASKWHNNNHLTNFTYTTPRAIADYSFYGYNLGVLGTNNCPGYLVETVFHDYRPDGLRLKSDVYNKYTAWQLLIASRENSGGSAGATGDIKGCIIGDIRDLSESNGYTNYTARGRDLYLAVNSAKVVLKNSAGTQVATMTTDKCANGLYGFFDLNAGTYTIEVSKSGYKTQTKTVTVANNASTKQLFDLVKGSNEGIDVTPAAGEFPKVDLDAGATPEEIQFTVTRTGFTDPITITSSDPTVFPANQTQVPHGTNNAMTFKVSYKPTTPGSHKATITLKGGGFTKKITVSGTASYPLLNMSNGYTHGEVKGTKPAWLPAGGWGLLRNMCFGDGKLYIVNPSEGIIYVVTARTADLIGTLDMTGVSGGTFPVMDVKYHNGKIIACNLAAKVEEPLKVYVWDDDNAKATCILNTTNRDGVSRLGDTFDVEGNLSTGTLSFAYGGTDGDDSRVFTYAITNGTVATTPKSIKTQLDDGTLVKLGTSPRAVSNGDGTYWVMGQNYQPIHIGSDGKAITAMNQASLDNVIAGNDMEQFTFRGTPYVAATTYAPVAGTVTKSLTLGGAALIDATNGPNDGDLIKKYPKAGLGTTRNTNFSTSVEVNVNGDKGVEMWVLVSNQGLGYYKFGELPDFSVKTPALSADAVNLDFGDVEIGKSVTREFNVKGTDLTDKITLKATGTGFAVSPASFTAAQAGGKVSVTFTPTASGAVSGKLTVSTPGAESLTFTLSGNGVVPALGEIESLTEVWNISETAGNAAGSWVSLATPHTRSLAVNGNELYVLKANTSMTNTEIRVINSKDGSDTGRTLNLTGISGGTWPLSHIEMLGSSLYGSNCGEAGGTLKVYRWKTSSAAPETVLTYTLPADWKRLGENLSVWGNETDGKLMFAYVGYLLVFDVKNGVVNPAPTQITLSANLGGQNSTSGVQYNGDNTYTVISKDYMPTVIDANGKQVKTLPTAAMTNKYGTDGKFFNYGEKRYFAGTAYKTYTNAAGTKSVIAAGVLDVVDITDGIDKGVLKFTQPEAATGLGTVGNSQFVTDVDYQILDDGKTVNLYVLVPLQGVAKYTYSTYVPEIEGDRGHHAYNLHVEHDTDGVTLHYDLTGDVKNVRIHLRDRDTAANAPKRVRTAETAETAHYSYELGEGKAGHNTYYLSFGAIGRNYYDWTVEVESYPLSAGGKVFQDAPATLGAGGGVAVITDPESPAYGKIITSNGFAQGFKVYSPDHKLEGTYLAKSAGWDVAQNASLYRIAVRDNGLVYATDWSATASTSGSGIWTFDPLSPDTPSTNIFSGTKDSGGCWINNGVALGGRGSGLCFVGTGADTKLYSFQKDYPTAASSTQYLVRYDIGTADKITKAPVKVGNITSGRFANLNVNLVPDGNHGMFVCQVRGSGNQIPGCPGFVYIDFDGNILYNSGNHADIIPTCGSGLALSADRKTLAVAGAGTPIQIFDVTWAANGAPELTLREEIANSANVGGTIVPQMAFDNAGNLVAYQRSTDAKYNGLNIYTLTNSKPIAATPSSFEQYINSTTTGVEDITVEQPEESIYYDVRGIRMPDGENLVPGIYLKVTGSKVEKVTVK